MGWASSAGIGFVEINPVAADDFIDNDAAAGLEAFRDGEPENQRGSPAAVQAHVFQDFLGLGAAFFDVAEEDLLAVSCGEPVARPEVALANSWL